MWQSSYRLGAIPGSPRILFLYTAADVCQALPPSKCHSRIPPLRPDSHLCVSPGIMSEPRPGLPLRMLTAGLQPRRFCPGWGRGARRKGLDPFSWSEQPWESDGPRRGDPGLSDLKLPPPTQGSEPPCPGHREVKSATPQGCCRDGKGGRVWHAMTSQTRHPRTLWLTVF